MHPDAPVGVSVIIPVYNAQSYLANTLQSVADSSYSDFEVLLIDDCSTDQSAEMARRFTEHDTRFRYLRNKANRGVSFCRNRGLAHAKGRYICFVDSDDAVSADWIGNLVTAARESGAEVVVGCTRKVESGTQREYRMKGVGRSRSVDFPDVILKDNCVVWNKLYSAALIKRNGLRFEIDISLGEDLAFNYGVMSLADSIYCTDKGYYLYRTDNAASLNKTIPAARRIENFEKVLAVIQAFSCASGNRNRGAICKVCNDLLMADTRFGAGALSKDTRATIRRLAPSQIVSVRFKLFRRALRDRLTRRG